MIDSEVTRRRCVPLRPRRLFFFLLFVAAGLFTFSRRAIVRPRRDTWLASKSSLGEASVIEQDNLDRLNEKMHVCQCIQHPGMRCMRCRGPTLCDVLSALTTAPTGAECASRSPSLQEAAVPIEGDTVMSFVHPVDSEGRVRIMVGQGIATAATMIAACYASPQAHVCVKT